MHLIPQPALMSHFLCFFHHPLAHVSLIKIINYGKKEKKKVFVYMTA